MGFQLVVMFFTIEPIRVRLVIFQSAHPARPVFWPHPAGLRPGARCVELAMPLKGPQLLETYFADGPVHEEAIHKSVVTVHARRE